MKLFLGFALQEFTASAMYRLEFWMRLAGTVIEMYGVYWLWNTLYIQKPALFSTSLEQMLTYALLAVTLDGVMAAVNFPRYYISSQMRSGAIQMDLLRPLDFPFHLIARSSGQMIFLVCSQGLLSALIGALLLGIRGPASWLHAILFVLSLGLAFMVGFSLNFLVGLIAVYSIGASRISWVYQSALRFFSGQMVPLWYFPPVLAQITAFLPFQALAGIPLSIYIGRYSVAEAIQALGLQALWAAALLGLGRLAWNRAYTRLTVQGG